jgi:hypothetical protein
MRIIVIILANVVTLLSINNSAAQSPPVKLFLKEIGWTVTLPPCFNMLDSAEITSTQDRGKAMLEKANDVELNMSGLKTLASAKKGFNYFDATINSFDPEEDGNYEEAIGEAAVATYRSMAENLPDATIDSVTTSQVIDGLRFEKFEMTIKISPQVTMTMIVLSKYYKGFDFGISYLYLDEGTRKDFEEMFDKSRFAK